MNSQLSRRVEQFVEQSIIPTQSHAPAQADPFWKGLTDIGTQAWLDTGDIEAAQKLWTAEFSGLTTNNTLLNKEIQKGVYDELIPKAADILANFDLNEKSKIIEIAFILNAIHGQRLANRFGAMGTKISVELHTDLGHNVAKTIKYAKRLYLICPKHFVIKIPFTPAGLIATHYLQQNGIPVNLTLGFSARQNYLATVFAKPQYVNIFLGRINSYLDNYGLGEGMLGEKTVLACQNAINIYQGREKQTSLIAASIRDTQSLADLAGTDVLTIPVSCAQKAKKELSTNWSSALGNDYLINYQNPKMEKQLAVFFEIDEKFISLAQQLNSDGISTVDALIYLTHDFGFSNLFPILNDESLQALATDGKIPNYYRWEDQLVTGQVASDSLLTLAGLATFAKDQKALDDRIRSLI